MASTSIRCLHHCAAWIAGLMLVFMPAAAQARVPAPLELERLLAPVALYPDALLAQVLIAATRPAEVMAAARWSAANPGWEGDAAMRAVEPYRWDPAVRSLVAFPPLLARLAARPEWLNALGHAFVLYEPSVMEAVQVLRRRALAAGNLRGDHRVRSLLVNGNIVLQSVDPYALHIPWYDPLVVYGPWPWQAVLPVRWPHWPGALRRPHGLVLWWGPGIRIATNLFRDPFDWRHRRLHAVHRHGLHLAPPSRVMAAPLVVAPRAHRPIVPRAARVAPAPAVRVVPVPAVRVVRVPPSLAGSAVPPPAAAVLRRRPASRPGLAPAATAPTRAVRSAPMAVPPLAAPAAGARLTSPSRAARRHHSKARGDAVPLLSARPRLDRAASRATRYADRARRDPRSASLEVRTR